jgi:hypothetical protein
MRSLAWTRALLSRVILLCVAAAVTVPTQASETISYAYDTLGRLVKVARSGTVNNGASACYTYDKADNRTNVTSSTSSNCSPPSVSFSVNDVSVIEGGNLLFTVTKTGTATGTLTVSYATANGTAVAGSDYTTTSGTLSFLSTDTAKTVSVPTIDDAAVESAETVLFNLSNASTGATISDSQGVGTINDNDSLCGGVSFTIASNGAVAEGGSSLFTVTKSGSASGSCSVNYATAGGTATSGSDFTASSGTLTFTSTQTSQQISVATIDDTAVESAETFTTSLSSPTGGSTLGSPSTATATINDNDSGGTCTGVSYSINDVSGTEGDVFTFTVTKAGATSNSCSVNYATANGTAVAGTHYVATSGTLTFTSTQTSRTTNVTTYDLGRSTGTKTMYVNLSSPTGGATVTDSQGIGSIGPSGGGGGCPLCF